jgi:hypothetical protein
MPWRTWRQLALGSRRSCRSENFRVEPVERMTFPDAYADVVVSSAVLHFAVDDRQFDGIGREYVAGCSNPAACYSVAWRRPSGWRRASGHSGAVDFSYPMAASGTSWMKRCSSM